MNKVNIYILSKDYNKAFSLLNLIEKKQIFRNESIYKTKVLLSIKRPSFFINSNLKSSEDYILKSFILSQINQQENSKSILREGLKLYPEKDTLTKLYELFSFISVNKSKKLEVVYDTSMVVNKILTTKDSKWMLDLLRKNEKFLSY
ncbi:MAG: hypothetical protein HQ448_11610 [Cytophagales bacterium]|nr:hypothetical protein [Cytophagales bacterium]